MVPALGSARAAAAPLTRFGFVYVPHGVILDKFIPAAEGADFEFKPIMKPVEPFRNQLTVLSNIMGPPDGGGGHSGAAAMWLNGETPKKTEAEDVRAGMTVDQIIAKKRGSDTMYPSLELATEDLTGLIGSCDTGFSCTYINTLSWATPTTPLPMEINPRVVFERMFGDGGTRAQRLARSREDQSILDSIKADAGRLSRGLGAGDQKRVADYLENVREIERRIQSAEKQAESSIMLPDAPVGVPDNYDEHVALMFDLMTIAYQTDITRVATFMMARELSNRTYPQVGVADPHHSISHHQNNTAIMDKHATVNTHHMTLFAKFLATEEHAGATARFSTIDDRVWQRHGERQHPLARSFVADDVRRGQWKAEGQPSHQGGRQDAPWQRAARAGRSRRRRAGQDRPEHRQEGLAPLGSRHAHAVFRSSLRPGARPPRQPRRRRGERAG